MADRRERADGFGDRDRDLEREPVGAGERGVEHAMKRRRALVAGIELVDRSMRPTP